ncbi:MAG TPA: hypothetical protein VF677_04285, partial [Flavobacterium sp.]
RIVIVLLMFSLFACRKGVSKLAEISSDTKSTTSNNNIKHSRPDNSIVSRTPIIKVEATDYYRTSITDSFLVRALVKYIKSNKISPDSAVISLSIEQNDYRVIAYLTHEINDISNKKYLPGSYSILNGYLIFVYSEMDSFTKESQYLRSELASVINDNNIHLNKDKFILFEPPVWSFVKCGDREEVIVGDYYENNLPCGLKTEIQKGKLVIIEESWLQEEKRKKNIK